MTEYDKYGKLTILIKWANVIKCNEYDKYVKMLQMWLPIAMGTKYDKVWLRWQSVKTVTKCEKV